MSNQTARRTDTKDRKGVEVSMPGTPSWLRYGEGHARITLEQYHPAWVSVRASEYSKASGRTREVMFSLSRESAIMLRDFFIEATK